MNKPITDTSKHEHPRVCTCGAWATPDKPHADGCPWVEPNPTDLDTHEILARFRQHCVHGIMSDTPFSMTLEEAEDAIQAMIARECDKAREAELWNPIFRGFPELEQPIRDRIAQLKREADAA